MLRKAKCEKIYTVSLLRLTATLFIVSCHFFQYYKSELAFWLNVGVQMFFCISGFLYGSKKIPSAINFLLKGFRKILIPYFCFLFPALLVYFIFHRQSLSVSAVIHALLTSSTIEGLGHLWFISYILFCYLITPYLQALADKMKLLKWYAFLLACGMLFVLGFALSYAFDSFFTFSRIFCYIFGYFGAVFLQRYKPSVSKTLTIILAAAALLMNAAKVYFKYISPRSSVPFHLFAEYAHAFLGIAIVFVFIVFLRCVKKSALLELSDKYSFSVYIVHQLFILSPFSLLTVSPYKPLNCVIAVLAIGLSAVVLKLISDLVDKLFSKIFSFPCFTLCFFEKI